MGMGAPKASPKPSPKKKKSTTLGHLFKLDSEADALALPPPSASSPIDDILVRISNCTNTSETPTHEDLHHNLSHILSFLRCTVSPIDDVILAPLISMLAANIFRARPPPTYSCLNSDFFDDETPTMVLTPSWPSLHIVYDVFVTLVDNANPKSLRSYIDRPFLLNLVSLFQSEDPRERDRVKIIFHQIYSKLTAERSFMRRSMSHAFLHYVFECERHCGIAEMMEIWGSIINGFTLPLKEEHKMFLMRVLLPLHKPKAMHFYHRQLSYCVAQFVQKEPGLGETVIKGIVRYWPLTNCQKEVLLIGELEDLVENMDPGEFQKVAVVLCSQIAKSMTSCNSQVAERALYVWNNEQFVRKASKSMQDILPAMVQAIEKNIRWHWSKSVQQLTISVKKMLEDMETNLYSKCLQDLDLRESITVQEEKKRKEQWERLELVASFGHFLQPTSCI